MELLLGAVVSVIGVGIRKLIQRYGKELTSSIMLVVAFVASIGAAIGYAGLQANPEMLMRVTEIFSTAIAFYEVVVKRIISPVLDKLNS